MVRVMNALSSPKASAPAMFDFDTVIDRRGRGSKKWDALTSQFGIDDPDGLAFWVADMDFHAPPSVRAALQNAVDHGVFGYHSSGGPHHEAVAGWMQRRHGWQVDTEWIVDTPGIVAALHVAVRAFCEPGGRVVIQTPLYHPFAWAIENGGREVVNAPLAATDGRYELDFEALDASIDDRTGVVMLCSPHNPVGRVWTADELARFLDICHRHNAIVVVDEIHHDLIFSPHNHTVAATLDNADPSRIVTLTAASKTFNLAGLKSGNVIIADANLRARYVDAQEKGGTFSTNMFGPLAATAAYNDGAQWLDALLVYLATNRDIVTDVVARELPGVTCRPVEGTYLAWLDFSGTGLSPDEISDRTLQAGLALNEGPMFGLGGENFMRLNFACPRSVLMAGLERLVGAFNDR